MLNITSAKAYANNEVVLVAWNVAGSTQNCLGFEVTRLYPDTGEMRILPAWVPFDGQSNPQWLPQTTSVWPVQKLWWRDLTARKRRDQTALRPADVRVRYRIRPVGPRVANGADVPMTQDKSYEGDPLLLSYLGPAVETNDVVVGTKNGSISAAFTNGILAAQWLKHALEDQGENLTTPVIREHISTPDDAIREYLTGDVLGMLKSLLVRAAGEPGAKVLLALYELSDRELVDALKANRKNVRVILSNSSRGRDSGVWDEGNVNFRDELHATAGLDITDRMFNNTRIGHNKFAVLIGANGQPQSVMTGSTNWTPTGLCGQSNNAVVIESPVVAAHFCDYWQRLLTDTEDFVDPAPAGVSTTNAQGPALRNGNMQAPIEDQLPDGTRITAWFSPNTKQTTKPSPAQLPPDLAQVFSLMRKAEKAILFAAFLPSRSGKDSIISEAISIGTKDPTLLVYGAISDPTAMPNYVPPAHPDTEDDGGEEHEHKIQPATFDQGRTHVVRASALGIEDVVGAFEREELKVGNAIIHDKIVVVDPLSEKGFVVLGSHNLGFKASYANDENFVIIRNNPGLIQAYAVHVLDVYDHYRFRAVAAELRRVGKKRVFDGFLSRNDHWLKETLNSDRAALAQYFAG